MTTRVFRYPVAFLHARLDEARATSSTVRESREVAAKRSILHRYEYACWQAEHGPGADRGAWEKIAGALERDVLDLAAIYRDHPDYRQGWQPRVWGNVYPVKVQG